MKQYLDKLLGRYDKWKKSLSKTNRKLLFILVFLLRFLVLAIPLYVIIYSGVNLYFLEKIEAHQANFFINIFTNSSVVDFTNPETGKTIPALDIDNLSMLLGIDNACTGYRSMLAFAALVIALQGISWKKRGKALLIGIPIIYVINIFRLVITPLIVLWFGEQYFNIVHTFLWREGLIALILLMWIAWIKIAKVEIKY